MTFKTKIKMHLFSIITGVGVYLLSSDPELEREVKKRTRELEREVMTDKWQIIVDEEPHFSIFDELSKPVSSSAEALHKEEKDNEQMV